MILVSVVMLNTVTKDSMIKVLTFLFLACKPVNTHRESSGYNLKTNVCSFGMEVTHPTQVIQ